MIAVCPKCDEALILMELNNIQVDYCHTCHGIWLDEGELEAIIDLSTPPNSDRKSLNLFQNFKQQKPDKSEIRYLCPRCDRYLKEIVSNELELKIEICPRKDGIWFDKEELQKLLLSHPNSDLAANAIRLLQNFFGAEITDGDSAS